jgi:hypothetical protein
MVDLGLEHFSLASLLFLSDYCLVLYFQQIAVDDFLSRRMILGQLAWVLQASDLLGVCCQANYLLSRNAVRDERRSARRRCRLQQDVALPYR